MRSLVRVLLTLMLSLFIAPTPILAQDSDWHERGTERFAILYGNGNEHVAEQYASFVDSIYDEIATIFGHRTATPVTLRLYPSLERYYQINPLARNLPGIVAHADFHRREVVVIVPQTQHQTPNELQNNIRHELTHIVAAELSGSRLNIGFQEGLAQYVEHPSRELEAKILLLRRAVEQDQLLSWSELDDRQIVYENARISYPQSLSIVAFLVERYSFAKMREFLTIAARSSGYRSALQRTFGASSDELEQAWSTWLPSYLDGGYRHNTLTPYNLTKAEELLRQGRYHEARRELEEAIKWLQTTDQAETMERAETLLERVTAGQRAEALANEARSALEQARYADAAAIVEQARRAYSQLGQSHQDAVLEAYAERAERGKRTNAILREAEVLARELRYPQARETIDRAIIEYTALGNQTQLKRALALRSRIDRRQALLGSLLLLLGCGSFAGSILHRWRTRETVIW